MVGMSRALPIASARPFELRETLRIGDLARRTHKSTRAVRLYEEMGLLGPVHRTDGGHRVYSEDALIRMSWIDKLQALGFSLTQIREILTDWSDSRFGPKAMARVRGVFRAKLAETNDQLRQLEALSAELEDSLAYLESCEVCSPSTLLGDCSGCSQPHPVDAEPELVAGFHVANSPNEDEPSEDAGQ